MCIVLNKIYVYRYRELKYIWEWEREKERYNECICSYIISLYPIPQSLVTGSGLNDGKWHYVIVRRLPSFNLEMQVDNAQKCSGFTVKVVGVYSQEAVFLASFIEGKEE